MARIRYLKPDFWTDEKVVELSPLARLLFMGLWNFADREGRMVYSPAKIKMQIFPADSLDITELIGELSGKGLVTIYEASNANILSIPNFKKHQNIHPSEPQSRLPGNGAVTTNSAKAVADQLQDAAKPGEKSSATVGIGTGTGTGTGIGTGTGTENRKLEPGKPAVSFNSIERARILCEELDLSGKDMMLLADECIQKAMSRQKLTAELAGDYIRESWSEYARAPDIQFKCGIVKFLKTGLFNQKEQWRPTTHSKGSLDSLYGERT